MPFLNYVDKDSVKEYSSVCALLDECLCTIDLIENKLEHVLLPSNPTPEEKMPEVLSAVKYKARSVLRELQMFEQRIEK